jgi:transcriptional regulator with XRE-family HTH domain
METGYRQFGAWIRKTRSTQRETARALGISDGYLSQILSGLRRPKLELLHRISTLTGVPVSSWLDAGRGNSDLRSRSSAK